MLSISCLRRRHRINRSIPTLVFVILSIAYILCQSNRALASEVEFPYVSAQSAAVLDSDSGRLLYEKNSSTPMKVASTTKIMTAILVLENCNLNDTVKITREHYAEGSSMYLKEGEELTVRDLLYGLLLMSGNDAALALAHHCSGGPDEFAVLMNAKASEIGMTDSSFRNPNGLDAEGHHSTAKDMAVLASYCLKNKEFREIVGTKAGSFGGRYMTNNNKLLQRLEGCTGIKTGYTRSAGRCLVSSTLRNGREIVVVTLNAPNDWNDHIVLHNRAFDAYNEYQIGLAGMVCTDIPVQSGEYPKVELVYSEDCITWVAEGEKVETVIYADRFVYAPVRAGEHAGEIVVSIEGREIRRVPLVFSRDIEEVIVPTRLFERMFRNLVDIVSGITF